MTHTDQADAIDTWVGALRSDIEPAPSVARERIAARLVDAGLAAGAVAVAGAAATAVPRGFWFSKALVMLATLPVGIVIGAAGHAWLARPVAAPVTMQALPTTSVAVAGPPMPDEPVGAAVDPLPPPEPLNPQPVAPKARPPASAASAEAPGLEQELRLLEQARTRLSEGQPLATLEQLRQHRAKYPQSALEQEREALAIRALMATGRRAEAQKRAAAFVERYPGSMLRGAVERAVGTIP